MNEAFKKLIEVSSSADRQIEYTVQRLVIRPAGYRERFLGDDEDVDTVPVYTPVSFAPQAEPNDTYSQGQQITFGTAINYSTGSFIRADVDCDPGLCVVGAYYNPAQKESAWQDLFQEDPPEWRYGRDPRIWTNTLHLQALGTVGKRFWLVVHNSCTHPKDALVKKRITIID